MATTYKSAGVDIDAGNKLVDEIKSAVRSTHRNGVLTDIGGFGGLFSLAQHRYKEPVLVSGTDGVGTKLRLAQQLDKHDTIGIDLVAMCANDVIVQGAEPLFFLDYFATGKLSVEQAKSVIEGIAEGCRQAGAALIGGETAEMPGMYDDGEYDLAGFCVGIVEKENIIDGSKISEGDVILGLHSSGLHSNGYSLVNKILKDKNISLDEDFNQTSLGEVLLTPTTIYTKIVLELIQHHEIHGLCHITGGGIIENVPRILPKNVSATIDTSSWSRPDIFQWIQDMAKVDEQEMQRIFNCGMGMLVILPEKHTNNAMQICKKINYDSSIIGVISKSATSNVVLQ